MVAPLSFSSTVGRMWSYHPKVADPFAPSLYTFHNHAQPIVGPSSIRPTPGLHWLSNAAFARGVIGVNTCSGSAELKASVSGTLVDILL